MWWGLGACFLVSAYLDWSSPPLPPFTGKWSWLYSWAHTAIGMYGVASLEATIACVITVVGILNWVERTNNK